MLSRKIQTNSKLGIDLGSATAKVVLLSNDNKLLYKEYTRHNGRVKEVLIKALLNIKKKYSDIKFTITITGTAGMGLAKRIDLKFEQEVVALSHFVKTFYPKVSTLIELGGEDAKIVLFSKNQAPEMRMNGSCAGGTGSFIDQMASLLNIDLNTLNELSKNSTKKLYIASRCGVFAKTDVQALLNKGENREDIAKAIFNAVANQAITALLLGAKIKPRVLFAGGPLTFLSELRKSFIEISDIDQNEFILPENSEVLVAMGSALLSVNNSKVFSFSELFKKLNNEKRGFETIPRNEPLFKSKKEYIEFKKRHKKYEIKTLSEKEREKAKELFLGIDAGSTTTKLILIDKKNNIVDTFYSNNFGIPLEIAIKGIEKFKKYAKGNKIKAAFSTGYGEEFIKTALNLDGGIVETMAHYLAGSLFNKNISYIVDVGGQDIKAMKVENSVITDIKLNEACSSGTGSFIQTFADSLNMSLDEFVEKALFAKNPVDLGTRCSVFMNSKVKEALKDGVSVDDIAAGLSYSVVKNALFKVIMIKSIKELGNNIFVQGGTFKNDAVLRAFELLTKKNVIRLNISEYMGAFGAALYAKEIYENNSEFKTKFNIENIKEVSFKKWNLRCNGCGNQCSITKFKFSNNNVFYTGNRCERFFSNKSIENRLDDKDDFFRFKDELIFNPSYYIDDDLELPKISKDKPVIGIPRVLSLYEHYPFFYSLFRYLGIKTILSDATTESSFYKGLLTVTVDNICLPAKVANSHFLNLIEKKVDRIFYPSIIFEKFEGDLAVNSYNCPIVTGYGEVIKKSIKTDIPIDTIPISFRYTKGIVKNIHRYLKDYNISENEVKKAVKFAISIEKKVIEIQRKEAKRIIEKAKNENKPLIIVLGRPYHLDPLINNGIMDLIFSLGAYSIAENAIPDLYSMSLEGVLPLTQWSYHNRLYLAAKWVAAQKYDKIAAIQLNSFGCGPDAVVVDEVKTILETAGKVYISIKIDEMSNIGAAKIRIRSVLESLKQNRYFNVKSRKFTKPYIREKDKNKTLLVPYFQNVYSDMIEAVFYHLGYKLYTLRKQSHNAVEEGLKYVNNDMCYPAVVVIGDILYALKNGIIDPNNTVVGLSETGGQCRASNYVPLLKKALIDAGFYNTPVVSLSASSFKQGFKFNPLKLLRYSAILFSVGDAIMRMKLRTKPYEKNKGETVKLVKKLTKELKEAAIKNKITKRLMLDFTRYAIKEFNKIDVNYNEKNVKKVGVVGEIYLKSNCFSNNYIVNWLEDNGYEVKLPSFVKFFEYSFFSNLENYKKKVHIEAIRLVTGKLTQVVIDHYKTIVEKELIKFRRYEPEMLLKEVVKKDSKPLPLYINFGEGWLLAVEIVEMIKEEIKDVISLQPFGCISNHIVAKGIYRYLKESFDLNMLLLDFEAGYSEANVLNRIKLFLNH